MNAVTAKIVIEAYSINAEIEAMKAANWMREMRGETIAYAEEAFQNKANILQNLSNILHEHWQRGLAE